MGRPLPGYELALLGSSGKEAAEGDYGRAVTAAHGLMVGYQDDEARNSAVMAAGYYRTGDEATRDAYGHYHFLGRGDDLFKSSDYRISPFELESALLEHPSVAEAAVVPCPDPLRLFVPKAFVALKPGIAPSSETAASVFAFARARLAPYQRINRIQFIDLPKTISGRIRRVALRQQEHQHSLQSTRPPREFRLDEL